MNEKVSCYIGEFIIAHFHLRWNSICSRRERNKSSFEPETQNSQQRLLISVSLGNWQEQGGSCCLLPAPYKWTYSLACSGLCSSSSALRAIWNTWCNFNQSARHLLWLMEDKEHNPCNKVDCMYEIVLYIFFNLCHTIEDGIEAK